VTLSLAKLSPVLGVDDETELRIVATGPFASPLPFPRILCSAGRVEDLVREGPTKFSARFILPSSRFPHAAIVVADFSHDSLILRGSLAVRLRAAAVPAFLTDPGASVTVRVGTRSSEPVIAPADGTVRVPVVVPPGTAFALARSVNRHGKASQQFLDLKIPPAQRALVVAPEKLAAAVRPRLPCWPWIPTGACRRIHDRLASSGPKPQPLGSLVPGEARFLVRVPASLQDPTLHLIASMPEQARGDRRGGRGADFGAHRPGSAAAGGTRPDRIPIHSLRVFLSAQDAFGNPTDAGEASVLVDGQPVSPHSTEDGRAMILLLPLAVLDRRGAITVEAS